MFGYAHNRTYACGGDARAAAAESAGGHKFGPVRHFVTGRRRRGGPKEGCGLRWARPIFSFTFPQSIVVGSVYWGTPFPAAAGPLSVKWSVVVFVVAGSRSRSTLNLGVDFTQPQQYWARNYYLS